MANLLPLLILSSMANLNSSSFCLLSRHKDLNNALNVIISCNLSLILDISEMLQPYGGIIVSTTAPVNNGDIR